MFPELRPHLEAAFDEAEPGTFVITKYRDASQNLRTHLQRIIQKAGLKPWPKLFQNLRSTRETELAENNPLHVVTAWLGNSQIVAAKHYLQVTDEHFERALMPVQNPVQQRSETGRNEVQPKRPAPDFSAECVGLRLCTSVQVGDEGLEPATSTV